MEDTSLDDEAELITQIPSLKEKYIIKYDKVIVLAVVLMFILFMAVSLVGVIFVSTDQVNENIHLTTEYQITIPVDVLANWKSRQTEMENWMKYFEKNSKYFHLAYSEVNYGTRFQYYIATKGKARCNSNYEIRVRDFVDGYMAGKTTVDIKGNSKFEYFANQYNFKPSPNFASNSSQKLERDEHGCDHKYSRETRIYLEEQRQFYTCLDVVELFPYAYTSLTAPTLMNNVTKEDPRVWFEQEYSGTLDTETMYKAAFTLKYRSLDEALDESAPPYFAEWSIRVFSLEEGFSGIYNEDVKEDVVHAWKKLIDNYGNDCECVLCF